jgi:glycosyltransferase involved in cell wall biosynthesis
VLIGIDASRVNRAHMTGTERYARALIDQMLSADHTNTVRLYAPNVAAARTALAHADAAEWRVVRAPRLWTHWGLSRELARDPVDALFVPAHVLPISFAMRAQRARTRGVVTIHDCGFRHFPEAHPARARWYLEWSTQFAVDRAATLIADSEATKRDLVEHFHADPDRVVVAYPGLMPVPAMHGDALRAKLAAIGVAAGEYALHIGTQHRRKNLRRLIEAWLCAGLKDAQLVLAGAPGYGAEDLRALVAELHAERAVRILGYVDEETRTALLRGARAYLFPSLYEGFGFGVLEAQSVEVPVACSNTTSLAEVAGAAAETFDPTSIAAMCAAIKRVMTDAGRRDALRAAGPGNVARFSWALCADVVFGAVEDRGR